MSSPEKFSLKTFLGQGTTGMLQLGLEAGIGQFIEGSLAARRGRTYRSDRIIAGAAAGAICGIPGGKSGVLRGAARGAMLSSLLVLGQTMQDGW
jgi:hypothetical protein